MVKVKPISVKENPSGVYNVIIPKVKGRNIKVDLSEVTTMATREQLTGMYAKLRRYFQLLNKDNITRMSKKIYDLKHDIELKEQQLLKEIQLK